MDPPASATRSRKASKDIPETPSALPRTQRSRKKSGKAAVPTTSPGSIVLGKDKSTPLVENGDDCEKTTEVDNSEHREGGTDDPAVADKVVATQHKRKSVSNQTSSSKRIVRCTSSSSSSSNSSHE